MSLDLFDSWGLPSLFWFIESILVNLSIEINSIGACIFVYFFRSFCEWTFGSFFSRLFSNASIHAGKLPSLHSLRYVVIQYIVCFFPPLEEYIDDLIFSFLESMLIIFIRKFILLWITYNLLIRHFSPGSYFTMCCGCCRRHFNCRNCTSLDRI